MQLDAKLLEAIARLSRTPDGLMLLNFIDAEAQTWKNLLIDLPMDQVPKAQGKARVLQDLSRLLREAPELADKKRQAKP